MLSYFVTEGRERQEDNPRLRPDPGHHQRHRHEDQHHVRPFRHVRALRLSRRPAHCPDDGVSQGELTT